MEAIVDRAVVLTAGVSSPLPLLMGVPAVPLWQRVSEFRYPYSVKDMDGQDNATMALHGWVDQSALRAESAWWWPAWWQLAWPSEPAAAPPAVAEPTPSATPTPTPMPTPSSTPVPGRRVVGLPTPPDGAAGTAIEKLEETLKAVVSGGMEAPWVQPMQAAEAAAPPPQQGQQQRQQEQGTKPAAWTTTASLAAELDAAAERAAALSERPFAVWKGEVAREAADAADVADVARADAVAAKQAVVAERAAKEEVQAEATAAQAAVVGERAATEEARAEALTAKEAAHRCAES